MRVLTDSDRRDRRRGAGIVHVVLYICDMRLSEFAPKCTLPFVDRSGRRQESNHPLVALRCYSGGQRIALLLTNVMARMRQAITQATRHIKKKRRTDEPREHHSPQPTQDHSERRALSFAPIPLGQETSARQAAYYDNR